MLRFERAAWCIDCQMLFEIPATAQTPAPCCGRGSWVLLARFLEEKRHEQSNAVPSQLSRFEFLMRWAPRQPADAFKRFMCDLGVLVATEHAIARRRLVSDGRLFAEACDETAREIAQQKAAEP